VTRIFANAVASLKKLKNPKTSTTVVKIMNEDLADIEQLPVIS
jgi:hypothetical protein